MVENFLVGVIADTHIPERAQEMPSQLKEIFRGVDLILHAGDLVELQVLEWLGKLARWEAVAGNMDPPAVRNLLPVKKIITLSNFRIGLIHGSGAPGGLVAQIQREFRGEKLDCIVFGHSHQPYQEVIDGILFFNPGSPTDRVFSTQPTVGLLHLKEKIDGEIIRV